MSLQINNYKNPVFFLGFHVIDWKKKEKKRLFLVMTNEELHIWFKEYVTGASPKSTTRQQKDVSYETIF